MIAHFFYKNRLVSAAFNIANDADDTAACFRAIKLYNKICQLDNRAFDQCAEPVNISQLFYQHRDIKRPIPNYYNLWIKHGLNTGAYMTWFGTEHDHYVSSLHNKYQILPLGFNDIDCVVNANIMLALAEYDEQEIKK